VVLYEMLTRRTPFEQSQETTVFALMNRIATAPHTPLRSLDAAIPAAFEHIVDRALAKDPAERYQRAGEMAQDLRDFRNLQRPAALDADKPPALRAVPATRVEDDEVRTQLINDLDKFAEQFDLEQQARVEEEEAQRRRKEEEMRRWGEEQARRREDFERTRTRAAADDPAAARAAGIEALDKAMRAAFQSLTKLVRDLNDATPSAARPYELIYLGKLPNVRLSQVLLDNRASRVEGRDVTERVLLRYSITPSQPAAATLAGEDIGRCEHYLQLMRVPFQQRVLAKDDQGRTTRAALTVAGPLPCEVSLRADYEANAAVLELTNVRRLGRVQHRLAPEQVERLPGALARYIIGAEEELDIP
jgi:hypothetical protein